jgi:hypothetical protein
VNSSESAPFDVAGCDEFQPEHQEVDV